MRYTKYQYKKNNNKTNFLLSLVMTVVSAIVVGLILFKVIVTFIIPLDGEGKDVSAPEVVTEGEETTGQVEQDSNQSNDAEVVINNENKKEAAFEFIQCGYFGKEVNAKEMLSKIETEYNSFIIEEDGKFRVSAGVFELEKGESVSDNLNNKGISNTKVKFLLDMKDEVQGQIGAITEGYLNIINALNDKDVKSVDTASFKEWTKKLPVIDSGTNVEILKDYKSHIEQLENELKKENIGKEFEFIYKILNNFKE